MYNKKTILSIDRLLGEDIDGINHPSKYIKYNMPDQILAIEQIQLNKYNKDK